MKFEERTFGTSCISHTTFRPAATEDGQQLVYHRLQQYVHILTIMDLSSQAQEGISLVSAFMFETIVTVGVNLLAIVLFVQDKKLRKKRFFLVMNMALADVMLGTVSIPLFVYLSVGSCIYFLSFSAKSLFGFKIWI